jgi:spore germination protein GerM
LLVVLVLIAMAVAACDSDDSGDEGTTATSSATTEQQATTQAPAEATEVVVYFIDRNGVLVGERRTSDLADPLQATLSELSAGPEGSGLFPALESGAEVLSAEQAGSIALIDLNGAFADQIPGGGSTAQIESLAPLVYSAASVEGVESVSITVDGGLAEVPGLAFDLAEPLTPADLPIEVREPAG